MNYRILSRRELPKSLAEFEMEIPAEDIAPLVRRVLEQLVREAEIPGFRKGFAPETMIRERAGELALWEKAAGEALTAALAETFATEKIDAVGRPHIAVTMLAPGNPLRAKITVAFIPPFVLPDYKRISAHANAEPITAPPVEEKEVNAVIAEIQKISAERKKSDLCPGEAKEIAPLTDEAVRHLGNFKTVAECKTAVAENLRRQKEELGKQKRRGALLDALLSEIKVELPDILIESELARMEAELRGNLERAGAAMEKYLAEIKKTAEELRSEMRPDAERRARLHLLFAEIARAENITAPAETVEEETGRILKQNRDADEKAARIFVETFLTNQKVIEFLENQR